MDKDSEAEARRWVRPSKRDRNASEERAREVCARAHNLGRGADHAHRHVWDEEHGRVAGR